MRFCITREGGYVQDSGIDGKLRNGKCLGMTAFRILHTL